MLEQVSAAELEAEVVLERVVARRAHLHRQMKQRLQPRHGYLSHDGARTRAFPVLVSQKLVKKYILGVPKQFHGTLMHRYGLFWAERKYPHILNRPIELHSVGATVCTVHTADTRLVATKKLCPWSLYRFGRHVTVWWLIGFQRNTAYLVYYKINNKVQYTSTIFAFLSSGVFNYPEYFPEISILLTLLLYCGELAWIPCLTHTKLTININNSTFTHTVASFLKNEAAASKQLDAHFFFDCLIEIKKKRTLLAKTQTSRRITYDESSTPSPFSFSNKENNRRVFFFFFCIPPSIGFHPTLLERARCQGQGVGPLPCDSRYLTVCGGNYIAHGFQRFK